MIKSKKLKLYKYRINSLEDEENKKRSVLSKVFDQMKSKESVSDEKKQNFEDLDKIGKERLHWIEEISREAKEQELRLEVIKSEIARLSDEEVSRSRKWQSLMNKFS